MQKYTFFFNCIIFFYNNGELYELNELICINNYKLITLISTTLFRVISKLLSCVAIR